jgi:hypothetical protein
MQRTYSNPDPHRDMLITARGLLYAIRRAGNKDKPHSFPYLHFVEHQLMRPNCKVVCSLNLNFKNIGMK